MRISTAAGIGVITGVISGLATAVITLLVHENIDMNNKLKENKELIIKLNERIEILEKKDKA